MTYDSVLFVYADGTVAYASGLLEDTIPDVLAGLGGPARTGFTVDCYVGGVRVGRCVSRVDYNFPEADDAFMWEFVLA